MLVAQYLFTFNTNHNDDLKSDFMILDKNKDVQAELQILPAFFGPTGQRNQSK